MEFIKPEGSKARMDYAELAKEMRPAEDPNLTPEEAKKKQIKKPKIAKSVIKAAKEREKEV